MQLRYILSHLLLGLPLVFYLFKINKQRKGSNFQMSTFMEILLERECNMPVNDQICQKFAKLSGVELEQITKEIDILRRELGKKKSENIENKMQQNDKIYQRGEDYSFETKMVEMIELQEQIISSQKQNQKEAINQKYQSTTKTKKFIKNKHKNIAKHYLSESSQDSFDHKPIDAEKEGQIQKQNYSCLSAEMEVLAMGCQSTYEQCWYSMEPFFKTLSLIAHSFNFSLQFIGSFATGLWLPFSDIDCAFISTEHENNSFSSNSYSYVFLEETIEAVYSKILELGVHKRMTIVKTNEKFPIIKVELNNSLGNRFVEIFIFHNRKINVFKYVHYVLECIHYYPHAKTIFFVLRKFLEKFQLHDPKKDGLKSYALFLMISNHLRNYPFESLTQFITSLSYYYGFGYDYEMIESYEGEVQMKLNLTDPLNPDNNMGGKKTNIQKMQQMFKMIYYGIKMNNSKKLEDLMGLGDIA